jgi:hypothetical protein
MSVNHVDQVLARGQHMSPGSEVRLQAIGGVELENSIVFRPAAGSPAPS